MKDNVVIWVRGRVQRLVVFDLNINRYLPRYIGMVFTILFLKGIKVSISRKLTMKNKLDISNK